MPGNKKGKFCDRFVGSTFAYQIAARKLSNLRSLFQILHRRILTAEVQIDASQPLEQVKTEVWQAVRDILNLK